MLLTHCESASHDDIVLSKLFYQAATATDFLMSFYSLHAQRFRIQVTATDGDKDRPQNIVYFLTGQGIDPDNPANSKFDINRTTGEIFVLKVSYKILRFLLVSLRLLISKQKIELNGNNFHDFIFEERTC